ncbi:MAG: 2OG-Fe(II) oxygenase family protein [Pseudomonadota bacterium]
MNKPSDNSQDRTLIELERERGLGGAGELDSTRQVPVIDLEALSSTEQLDPTLWQAAVDCGFFQLRGHGFDVEELNAVFDAAVAFFELPEKVKSGWPLRDGSNAGWESMAQVRPSTGSPDQKESYQVTRPRMTGLWPDDAQLPGFRAIMEDFEARAWQLAMRVLSSFARSLGFDEAFFARAHAPESEHYQSTLRLLHYFPVGPRPAGAPEQWRAGAHTDFDCLTLLFQRDGQDGLQVCPGAESQSSVWTPVPAQSDLITCNIGDMLMRWSDDKLRSTLHRVRAPESGEAAADRYTIAFFAQANRDQLIEGPLGKYPPITAHDYLQQRIAANFSERSS